MPMVSHRPEVIALTIASGSVKRPTLTIGPPTALQRKKPNSDENISAGIDQCDSHMQVALRKICDARNMQSLQ
jgi:hypothetical protein